MSSNGSNKWPNLAQTPAPKSDREYLEREAQQARDAMRGTLGAMKDALVGGLDLPRAADGHPWMTVGAAAAVGLVTGGLVAARHPRRLVSKPSEPVRVIIQLPEREAPAPIAPAAVHQEGTRGAADKGSWSSQLTSYLGSLISPPLADILKAFAKDFVDQHITSQAPSSAASPSQAVPLPPESSVSIDSLGKHESETPGATGSGA